jgi:aspartate-semialdehyde dehydrogenase
MEELLSQMGFISGKLSFHGSAQETLSLESLAMAAVRDDFLPVSNFGAPLALSLIPWIDAGILDGRTKEEWKMGFETRKILGLPEDDRSIVCDSLCVRVPVLRCHSQSLQVKLKKKIGIEDVSRILSSANPWVEVVPNQKSATLVKLNPAYVSGGLKVAIGRLHYSDEMGENVLKAFTVGDQLLWGAAEPIRRILRIVSGNSLS